ncbi:MAG: DUF5009 domain-containing protein [Anaerolineales bacterium]
MKPDRISSIDQFRGFGILTMALANYMGGAGVIPAWLKHAPDVGLTVIDLIAPFFIFAIDLTYGLSFRHRLERDGAFKTYSHFLPVIWRSLAWAQSSPPVRRPSASTRAASTGASCRPSAWPG